MFRKILFITSLLGSACSPPKPEAAGSGQHIDLPPDLLNAHHSGTPIEKLVAGNLRARSIDDAKVDVNFTTRAVLGPALITDKYIEALKEIQKKAEEDRRRYLMMVEGGPDPSSETHAGTSSDPTADPEEMLKQMTELEERLSAIKQMTEQSKELQARSSALSADESEPLDMENIESYKILLARRQDIVMYLEKELMRVKKLLTERESLNAQESEKQKLLIHQKENEIELLRNEIEKHKLSSVHERIREQHVKQLDEDEDELKKERKHSKELEEKLAKLQKQFDEYKRLHAARSIQINPFLDPDLPEAYDLSKLSREELEQRFKIMSKMHKALKTTEGNDRPESPVVNSGILDYNPANDGTVSEATPPQQDIVPPKPAGVGADPEEDTVTTSATKTYDSEDIKISRIIAPLRVTGTNVHQDTDSDSDESVQTEAAQIDIVMPKDIEQEEEEKLIERGLDIITSMHGLGVRHKSVCSEDIFISQTSIHPPIFVMGIQSSRYPQENALETVMAMHQREGEFKELEKVLKAANAMRQQLYDSGLDTYKKKEDEEALNEMDLIRINAEEEKARFAIEEEAFDFMRQAKNELVSTAYTTAAQRAEHEELYEDEEDARFAITEESADFIIKAQRDFISRKVAILKKSQPSSSVEKGGYSE